MALGVNGIVGVGIFYAPADVSAGAPGWSSVLVFAATGLALTPVALTFAMLGRRFDEDGGPVVYARAAFGETAAFLVGWVTYVSAVASTAAVTAGLARSVLPTDLLGAPLVQASAAAALATLLALVCSAGIVVSARAWTALTVLKLVPLAVLVAASVLHGGPHPPVPAAAQGLPLASALKVAFTFQGFEIVPVIASQVRSPSRTIPAATLGSLGVAGLLYVALQAACVRALPHLAASTSPLADAGLVYGGARLATLMVWGASLSALGISFGMLVTTPRYLSALARGGTLSLGLDRMAPNGVPRRALALTWLLVVALLVQAGSLGELFDLAGVAVLMQYVVAALALAVLAHRRERGLAPSHALMALPAAAAGLALSYGATGHEWLVAGCAVALGLVLRLARR